MKFAQIIQPLCLISVFMFLGCVSRNYDPIAAFPKPSGSQGASLSIESLKKFDTEIETAQQLAESIDHYKNYVSWHPKDREALNTLSNQLILYGTAYTAERKDKRAYFYEAMKAAELSMACNPAYEKRAQAGETPWEACTVLEMDDMESMLFWSTAVMYIFKEGLPMFELPFNAKWMNRVVLILNRMEAIDRTWAGGAILFTRSLIYGALPSFAGGDEEKAYAYLEEAVQLKGDWMLSRWGRAKYIYSRTGNKDGFVADLEFIIAIDPNLPGEALYWRKYFRKDAQEMLAQQDQWF
jgi:hypothetical protein